MDILLFYPVFKNFITILNVFINNKKHLKQLLSLSILLCNITGFYYFLFIKAQYPTVEIQMPC